MTRPHNSQNITIRCLTKPHYGLGHFRRCLTLAKDFKKKVGIDLGNGITESYDVKGSSKVIVTYGTLFRKIKQHLNENKIKDYSVIRVRCINPFPKDHVAELCSNFDSVIVVEKKDLSFFSQVKQSLKDKKIDKLNYKGYEDLLKLK